MAGSNASFDRTSGGRAMEDKRQGSSVELSSSDSDDNKRTSHVLSVPSKDAQLESTKAEMREVRNENERLRMHLDRMIKAYQELQKQYQKATKKGNENIASSKKNQITADATSNPHQELEEENELVSLSLGRTSSIHQINHQGLISKGRRGNSEKDELGLGLGGYEQKLFEESKSDEALAEVFPLPGLENISSSAEDTAKGEPAVGGSSSWLPQNVLKRRELDNEPASHASSGKRARVCLRIRCETPTMNDGCQWRKYGQKISKGNPCPRAYYRCTVAPACPVRKQVQRCVEDMSILIITYEGTHNHPLPISATGMASTTSAAASMLLSGATNHNTSRPTTSLNGLNNFYAPSNTLFSNKHNIIQSQYQLPTSSSSSNPNPHHQTITLDLTSPNNTSSAPSPNAHFSLFPRSSSMNYPAQFSSRPTSLNFSSSSSPTRGNSSNNMYCYSNVQANTTSSSSNQFATSPLDHNNYQSTMRRNYNNSTDTTMTAAITSDPSFQSVLAAALTSIIGSREGPLQGLISGFQPGSSTSHGQGNNLMLGQPTQAAAVPKSTSTSPRASIKESSI